MRTLKDVIRFPIKFFVKLCFGNFRILSKFYLLLRFLHPKNHEKIITGVWKGCNVCQSYLSYWKYMLRVLTKLLGYLFLSYLLIFLRLYLVFDNVFFHKVPKNHHRSLKEVWHKPNLLFLFIIHVKICDKFIFLLDIL